MSRASITNQDTSPVTREDFQMHNIPVYTPCQGLWTLGIVILDVEINSWQVQETLSVLFRVQ